MMVAKKKRERVFGKRKRGSFETELMDGRVEPIEIKKKKQRPYRSLWKGFAKAERCVWGEKGV